MSRNGNDISEIIHAFREKSAKAREDADARRAELDAKFPEIAKIDGMLESTGLRILLAATKCEGDIKKNKFTNYFQKIIFVFGRKEKIEFDNI